MNSDSRLSQSGFLIKPTVNQKKMNPPSDLLTTMRGGPTDKHDYANATIPPLFTLPGGAWSPVLVAY